MAFSSIEESLFRSVPSWDRDVEGAPIPPAQRIKDLARSLVDTEMTARGAEGDVVASDFPVCARLRSPLSSVSGKAGFEALLSRALSLTKAALPRIAPLRVASDGCVGGKAEIYPHLSSTESLEAEVELVANLIHLLITFVGEALTLRLIQEAWPKASFSKDASGPGKTTYESVQ